LTEYRDDTGNIPANNNLQVDCLPHNDWPTLKQHWERISLRFSPPSFFLSLDWTETWIEIFGEQLQPKIIVFRDGTAVVGICLLIARTIRYGPFALRVLYINAAGEDQVEETSIEHNDLLTIPGYEVTVGAALGKLLSEYVWDELRCDGFRPGIGLETLTAALTNAHRIESARPSHYVDLCALRSSGKDYVGTLGSSTRSLLRRNFKLYKDTGNLSVRVAMDSVEALDMLTELSRLHQERWSSLGKLGAFSSERFRLFHKTLICRSFASGAIQLLHVKAGNSTIGYIYNFIDAGKVYFYQSGFDYTNKRLSPGLVVHVCAVQHCLDQGLLEYDFLAGDSQYKRSLSTNTHRLVWAEFRRRNWKIKSLDVMRRIKKNLKPI